MTSNNVPVHRLDPKRYEKSSSVVFWLERDFWKRKKKKNSKNQYVNPYVHTQRSSAIRPAENKVEIICRRALKPYNTAGQHEYRTQLTFRLQWFFFFDLLTLKLVAFAYCK